MNLTVTKSTNQREVEMMFGKAMCAYANWMVVRKCVLEDLDMGFDPDADKSRYVTAAKSEYEATVRCIAMFTVEHLPEVCQTIIDRAKSEFGI